MPENVCQNNGWGEVCGPWSITKPYWTDAYKPGGGAYEKKGMNMMKSNKKKKKKNHNLRVCWFVSIYWNTMFLVTLGVWPG